MLRVKALRHGRRSNWFRAAGIRVYGGVGMMSAIELIETLRNRSMYGDDYVPGNWHAFYPSGGTRILDAAYWHLKTGAAYERSTAAEETARYEYRQWCAEMIPATGKTRSEMLQGGFSVNELGGLLPEHETKFWQTERAE